LVRIVVGRNHTSTSCLAVRTMFARTVTSCVERDEDNTVKGTLGKPGSRTGGSSSTRCGQACIQAGSPCRMNKLNPQEPLADQAPFLAVRRRSSYRVVQLSCPASVATKVRSVAPFLPSAPEPVRCCGDAPRDSDASEGSPPVAVRAGCCRLRVAGR